MPVEHLEIEKVEEFLKSDTPKIMGGTLLFLAACIVIYLVYRFVVIRLERKAARTKTKVDDFIIDLLKLPFLSLLYFILFKIFSASYLSATPVFGWVTKVSNILVIVTVGWILIKVVRVLFYYLQNRLDMTAADNLNARKNYTKMKIFEGITVGIITVIIVAICLMTFDKVRTIGVSLLTSAGIAGIILGFAAQKSIAAVLAGIQIAITQPIRLEDVVIVEGEWGRVEEITLTYVVVRIWDERRLVLPVTYFLERTFQNWTRTSSEILGTVFLYVDYSLPVDHLREYLTGILKDHPKWDGRVANIQVTNARDNGKELRVLLSSSSSSFNWDLRVEIREKLIDFINQEYPGSFPKIRLRSEKGTSGT